MRFLGRWLKWSIISFIVAFILLNTLGKALLGSPLGPWGAEDDPVFSCLCAGVFFGFFAALKPDD